MVDDDPFTQKVLMRQLTALGTLPAGTATGPEGLERLRHAEAFDTVICDLQMPGMDGVEFMRHLAEAHCAVSIILISAEDVRVLRLAEDLARAHGLRFLGALAKPIKLEDLRRLLAQPSARTSAIVPHLPPVNVSGADLKAALQAGEIDAYVQPKIYTQTGKLAGAEALARWIRPGQPSVPPDVFIPLAEKAGLMQELTEVILHRALRHCGGWLRQGIDIQIAINFSTSTLHRLDLPELIVGIARTYKVRADQIIVEVTESGILQDESLSLDVLTRLRLKGIGLSIDDFGTGYSSMKQLQKLPFSELKLDRSFVTNMLLDPGAAHIVESSLQLARDLGVRSATAEGVESEAQLRRLAELGCTCAQGYYIAKAFPGDQLPEWAHSSGRL